MRINVKVKPNAKTARVEEIATGQFHVAVKEPAKENRANVAMLASLAKHFDVSLSRVRIVSGKTSRNKIIGID